MSKRSNKKTETHDIYTSIRSVNKIGQSLFITIPAEWAESHKIKSGDKVVAIANGILQITPGNIQK